LEALSQTEYDLIISDIVLEGPSGTYLLQKVRELGVKCPVVMITGFPNLESAAHSIRHSAFDYLCKPVKKETLLHFTRRAHPALVYVEQSPAPSAAKRNISPISGYNFSFGQ
jgi:two-component system, NtrC family, response regulator HydG